MVANKKLSRKRLISRRKERRQPGSDERVDMLSRESNGCREFFRKKLVERLGRLRSGRKIKRNTHTKGIFGERCTRDRGGNKRGCRDGGDESDDLAFEKDWEIGGRPPGPSI